MGATNNSGVHNKKEEKIPKQREQIRKPPLKSKSNRILLI